MMKKRKKSLAEIRGDLQNYIKEHPHLPDEYKKFIIDLATAQFNLISTSLGAIELTFRRTRDYPTIKTRHEKELKARGRKEKRI